MAVNWSLIDRLAKAHVACEPTINEKALLRFLKFWWCTKYDRPLKDPLLDQYTLDDLIYEYLIHFYLNPENNPKKQKQKESEQQDEMEWVKKMVQTIGTKETSGDGASKKEEVPKELMALPELSTNFDE